MAFLAKVLEKVKVLFAKASEYVHVLPWLQYVGLQVSLIPGLPMWAVSVAASVSFAAFLLQLKSGLGPNDPGRREGLAVLGYPVMLVGAAVHHPGWQFVGGALVMTQILYTVIYP